MGKKLTSKQVLSGDSNVLNNYITYTYLKNLAPEINELLESQLIHINNFPNLFESLIHVSLMDNYANSYPYYNQYRDLLLALQQTILVLNKNPNISISSSQQQALNNLLISMFENDNNALQSSQTWINKKIQDEENINLSEKILPDSLISKAIQKAAKPKLSGKLDYNQPNNATSPSKNGSAASNLYSVVGYNYQPMILGNIPTVRKYDYTNSSNSPTELRFSTQAEVVNNKARVNPLFQAYLDAKLQQQAAAQNTPEQITHIYFNALRRGGGAFERRREGSYTDELQHLEDKHTNIAVVTLPADGGLLELNHIHDNTTKLATSKVIAEIRDTALNNGPDFYISAKVRAASGLSDVKIEELIMNSLTFMGLDDPIKNAFITPSQRNALMFHFIKYELTNHLIENLKPKTMNFSCKDAIDRGGVHSLYYNFVTSLKSNHPLSMQEFMQGIHAAPTMVKGRGINHNSTLLWNAVNKCVQPNLATLLKDPVQRDETNKWLTPWLKANSSSKQYSLKTTINGDLPYDYNEQKHRTHYDVDQLCGWTRSLKTFITMLFFNLMSICNKIGLGYLLNVNCQKIVTYANNKINKHQYQSCAERADYNSSRLEQHYYSTKSPLLINRGLHKPNPCDSTSRKSTTPRLSSIA